MSSFFSWDCSLKNLPVPKIDESMECVDSPVSITELQLKGLVLQTRRIEKIMGSSELQIRDCEKGSLVFRRKS